MKKRPIIEVSKRKSLRVIIQHVFRGNFNDTYFLEEILIDLTELKNKEELVWFDPFNGRSKFNDTLLAIAYASDNEFIILEKKKENITEHKIESSEYIICEDYNKDMLLATHIRLWK